MEFLFDFEEIWKKMCYYMEENVLLPWTFQKCCWSPIHHNISFIVGFLRNFTNVSRIFIKLKYSR